MPETPPEQAAEPWSAWGKTDKEGRPAHHLAHHCMDVAAVLERLLSHPVIARRLATVAGRALRPSETEWLAAFAFLHDVGKLSPAFQAKAWPSDGKTVTRSHLAEGAAWIDGLGRRPNALAGMATPLLAPLIRAGGPVGMTWLTALFAHHGRPVSLSERFGYRGAAHYDWCAEERALGGALRAWFPGAMDHGAMEPELLGRPLLVHLFAGLLALADWIGSDAAAFPFERELDVDGYGIRARRQAREALRGIGLEAPRWPVNAPSFAGLTAYDAPRGAQALVGKLPLETPLVLLEAETGSGKTEAALWHFARLRSAGAVDALYFAVPTRAAAGQLHARVGAAMRRVGGPEAILAVPGLLRAGDATGRRLPGFEVLWDDGRRHWAAEHATRFLAAPVAVGTVDQALMASLKVKHAHMRGAALARSLLVIDEVHASDAYMNAALRRLVRDHMAIGGRAMLMSATLGAAQRAAWLGHDLPDYAEAEAVPYPALWASGERTPRSTAQSDHRKTVRPVAIGTMDPTVAAGRAIAAAERGARVLVIRNTVDRARETWAKIAASRSDLCLAVEGRTALHHSRFAAEDRERLDAAVEATFGKAASRGDGGMIAVGTQTLEQSLDIDADLLITDLCPMDVLLQRIGRLHRHDRPRPGGYEEAVVEVMLPESGLDALARGPSFENGLGAWRQDGPLQGIYIDLCGLEATRRCLDEAVWTIPKDNRRLVEAATHPDALRRIEEEMGWTDYAGQVVAKALAEAAHGSALSLDRSAPFPDAKDYPDRDEVVQTRLGAMGPVLRLPEDTVGPFGAPVTRLAPPAHWCRGLTGEEEVHAAAEGGGLRIEVGEVSFLYDTGGLTKP